MNGYLVGGLADGLVQGFQAVTQWDALKKEQARQEKQDAENATYRQHAMGLADAQMGMSREELAMQQQKQQADIDNDKTRLGLAAVGLGLDKEKTAAQIDLQRSQLGIQQGQLGLAQAANARAEQDQAFQNAQNSLKMQELQRQQKIQTVQREVVPKMLAGNMTKEDVDKWDANMPFTLANLANDQQVDSAVGAFHDLKIGKIGLDDERINQAADWLFHNQLQRGIGEKVRVRDAQGNPTGPEIVVTSKHWAGAYPTKDGKFGVNMWVVGKDDQGKDVKYVAPVTAGGTGDPSDPIVSFSGDALERNLAAAMHFNHAYHNDKNFQASVNYALKGDTDTKAEAEKSKLLAETDKAKTEAELNRAKNETEKQGGGYKDQASKMDDVRALIKYRLGDKLNAIGETVLQGDAVGHDYVNREADRLNRENPKLTATQLYDQAFKSYEAAKPQIQEEQIKADFKKGKLSKDEAKKKLLELGGFH